MKYINYSDFKILHLRIPEFAFALLLAIQLIFRIDIVFLIICLITVMLYVLVVKPLYTAATYLSKFESLREDLTTEFSYRSKSYNKKRFSRTIDSIERKNIWGKRIKMSPYYHFEGNSIPVNKNIIIKFYNHENQINSVEVNGFNEYNVYLNYANITEENSNMYDVIVTRHNNCFELIGKLRHMDINSKNTQFYYKVLSKLRNKSYEYLVLFGDMQFIHEYIFGNKE